MDDMASYMRQRRTLRRQYLITLCNSKCRICGSDERLEFDHIDPSTKSFNLTGCDLDRSLDLILHELSKCQLLCKKCHLEKSAKHNDYKGGRNKILNPKHGTAKKYEEGCKCDQCRNWKRLYRKKIVDSLGNSINRG